MRKKGAKTFYINKDNYQKVSDFLDYIKLQNISVLIDDFLSVCERAIPKDYIKAKTIEQKVELYKTFKRNIIEELKKRVDIL